MNAKCNCGKILKPGYIRCPKCEAARRDRVESLRWMADARETIIKDLECEIEAVADERTERKVLVADLKAEQTARKALVKALETCTRYADSGVAAVTAELTAERIARKALEEALWRANHDCCHVGHTQADQHAHDAPCPVESRIVAALALAAKLP